MATAPRLSTKRITASAAAARARAASANVARPSPCATAIGSREPAMPVNNGEGVAAISTSYYHSSAITIGGEVLVQTWGANPFGQFGDGTVVGSATPVTTDLWIP